MNQISVFFFYIGLIFFCPFGSLIYVIAPKSKVIIFYFKLVLIKLKIIFKIGNLMSLPFIKFFYYTLSYFIFLSLILVSSFQFKSNVINHEKLSDVYHENYKDFYDYVHNENLTYRFETDDFFIRKNDSPSNIDILICVWLVGNILEPKKIKLLKKKKFFQMNKGSLIRELNQMIIRGFRDYLLAWSNILTLFQTVLYGVTYGLRFYMIGKVAEEKLKLNDTYFWANLRNLTTDDINGQKEFYQTFYWLNNGWDIDL